MVTKLKTTIGVMRCMCCGESMPVKQAENGTLDLSCKHCDFSAYAKTGTTAHRHALDKVKRKTGSTAPAEIAAAARPATAPAPAPAARPAAARISELPATKRNTLFG